MKDVSSVVIGLLIVVIVALAGYWFWVPDVASLKNWSEFVELPNLECEIGGEQGFSGTMYVGNGRLRADYKVEGGGVTSTFHTIVYEDGTTYTWADTIDFAQKGTFDFAGPEKSNLFNIARCKRIWNLAADAFVVPADLQFSERTP